MFVYKKALKNFHRKHLQRKFKRYNEKVSHYHHINRIYNNQAKLILEFNGRGNLNNLSERDFENYLIVKRKAEEALNLNNYFRHKLGIILNKIQTLKNNKGEYND